MIPRRKFVRANSSASSSISISQLKMSSRGTRSSGSLPRRRASNAPPSNGIRYDFFDHEELLEKEAAAIIADVEKERLASRQYNYNDNTWPPVEDREFESGQLTAEDLGTISVAPVEAYYAAKTIDLAPLIMSSLTRDATRKKYNENNLLLELSPNAAKSTNNQSYVAVYRFGSVIFFNVSPRVQSEMLQSIKRYATEPQAKGFEQKDSFSVMVVEHYQRTKVTPEHCIVPQLNMNAVSVISEVMAQSVALESYNEIVDSLLDKFAILNSKISSSSKMDLDKKMLFSKIAENNRIFIDLISKLRIKGRSQIAWDQGEYEVIHSGLTMEFDIDDRFELIQFKLDLIQQNSKLFLEVIQHQKSASLEWIIVVLIGFECVLMCLEMSGQGAVMFENIKNVIP